MILRGKTSLCRTCGKVFTTTSTFDKHRGGKYDIAAPHYGRRCLTDAEMDNAGWGVNRYGRWFRAWIGPARAYVIRHSTIADAPLPCIGVTPDTSDEPRPQDGSTASEATAATMTAESADPTSPR